MSFSPSAQAEIDHLSIRGHKPGELVYKNDNTDYYLTTSEDGYYYFVAIHDVGTHEKLIERIFQEPNGEYNPHKQKEYIYSDKDLEIFRHHLLPELVKKSYRTKVIL